jgi:hypothetical protein
MKKIYVALILLLGLHLQARADDARLHYCQPDETNISCRLELALVCGGDYIDGCLTQATQVHKCVLRNEGASCDTPVQILCIQGFRDGCEIGRSTRHQCVPVNGPHCKSGEEWSCPEGFSDRCDM